MHKFILLIILALSIPSLAEEGMYPLSELKKIDLKEAGFEISAQDIFNEQEISLSDAIVKIGGCTGSFVSPTGLMLTNHHCAFYAVQAASDTLYDYVKHGFTAESREKELPARGYTVRITESYRDVSGQVLAALKEGMTLQEKHKAIEQVIKTIEKKAEDENPGKRAEVAEMFIGQTYVLFLYNYLKDVRMVYIPPRSIGEFGGDVDNWEWPRHNADFSFLRAYVGPDGNPAEYSEDNIPYQPKTFLKIQPMGLEEEDVVFILGYPGRTYRHRTSHYLSYLEDIRMPSIVDWYQWQIALIDKLGLQDEEARIKLSSKKKGLANTEKNYRGKLLGMKRLQLVASKQKQEQEILESLEPGEGKGLVLDEIGALYKMESKRARRNSILSYLTRHVTLMNVAQTVVKAAEEREKEDIERESAYMDRNFKRTKKYLFLNLQNYYEVADKAILMELLRKAQGLPVDQQISELNAAFPAPHLSEVGKAYRNTRLMDEAFVKKALQMSSEEIAALDDPLINVYLYLKPLYADLKVKREEFDGAITGLSAKWAELKKGFLKKSFIPDANGTFRLTFGKIRGYAPRDAVYMSPFTTLQGVMDKNTGIPPFNAPPKLVRRYNVQEESAYRSKRMNDIPVCILYNMDTTGGNSGSPVLNARGELVGLNFDRAFEATINDFAWSESYSRSIGVDIRYILWLLEDYARAGYLLQEMGI